MGQTLLQNEQLAEATDCLESGIAKVWITFIVKLPIFSGLKKFSKNVMIYVAGQMEVNAAPFTYVEHHRCQNIFLIVKLP